MKILDKIRDFFRRRRVAALMRDLSVLKRQCMMLGATGDPGDRERQEEIRRYMIETAEEAHDIATTFESLPDFRRAIGAIWTTGGPWLDAVWMHCPKCQETTLSRDRIADRVTGDTIHRGCGAPLERGSARRAGGSSHGS